MQSGWLGRTADMNPIQLPQGYLHGAKRSTVPDRRSVKTSVGFAVGHLPTCDNELATAIFRA